MSLILLILVLMGSIGIGLGLLWLCIITEGFAFRGGGSLELNTNPGQRNPFVPESVQKNQKETR